MEPAPRSRFSFGLRGNSALVVAVAVVAVLLIALPAYRWFFFLSLLIGLVIRFGLSWWYKAHPIEEDDVERKRPLGL